MIQSQFSRVPKGVNPELIMMNVICSWCVHWIYTKTTTMGWFWQTAKHPGCEVRCNLVSTSWQLTCKSDNSRRAKSNNHLSKNSMKHAHLFSHWKWKFVVLFHYSWNCFLDLLHNMMSLMLWLYDMMQCFNTLCECECHFLLKKTGGYKILIT